MASVNYPFAICTEKSLKADLRPKALSPTTQNASDWSLVAVLVALEGAFHRHPNVLGLCFAQFLQLHTDLG
jgi:hypothetical protein